MKAFIDRHLGGLIPWARYERDDINGGDPGISRRLSVVWLRRQFTFEYESPRRRS